MIRTLMLSSAIVVGVSSTLAAQSQTVRWNDRPTTSWDDEAPQVRVAIEGNRGYGGPLRVRFQVDDNAYVTVAHVDGDGRLTILYPESRNQRSAVRADQVYYARNQRLGGDFSFVANGSFGGYVFALASYAPLDFANFENRDFDRVGGWSAFTVANRGIARRPDVLIDRFAARVLWSVDTPYDYDVDYYSQFGNAAMNAYALCSPNAFGAFYGFRPIIGGRTFLAQFSSWERMNYPYFSLCNSLFDRYECYSWLTFSVFPSCLGRVSRIARFPTDINGGGGIPGGGDGDPSDSLPGKGGIKDQLFPKAPVVAEANGPSGRFDRINDGTGLDGIMSIPARATRKMKDDDARRERGSEDATDASRSGFDRIGADSKPEKSATADASIMQPPSRESTKAKSTPDRVREPTRSRTGFGTTTRSPDSRAGSSARDRDTGSRPAKASGSSGGSSRKPATSLGGTSTTGKKKPPQ